MATNNWLVKKLPKCCGGTTMVIGIAMFILSISMFGNHDFCVNTDFAYYDSCNSNGKKLCEMRGCDECYYTEKGCTSLPSICTGCADYNGDDTGAIIILVLGLIFVLGGCCLFFCLRIPNKSADSAQEDVQLLPENEKQTME